MLSNRMKHIIAALVLLGFGTLVLAQENTPTTVVTPFPTPITDPFPFPNGLFCSDIEVGLGPTWREITIGESTLDELQTLMMGFSENYNFVERGDSVLFSIFSRSEAVEKRIPSTLTACVQDGLVVAILINIPEKPPVFFLDDWITEMGVPDAVTWGNVSTLRTVFWFDEGVAASVLVVEPFGASLFQVYFPYQSVLDYETRWPFNRTRTSPVEHHEAGTPPPSEQNPFDFDSMVATITAEPSRTPTPTLTPLPTTPTATGQP